MSQFEPSLDNYVRQFIIKGFYLLLNKIGYTVVIFWAFIWLLGSFSSPVFRFKIKRGKKIICVILCVKNSITRDVATPWRFLPIDIDRLRAAAFLEAAEEGRLRLRPSDPSFGRKTSALPRQKLGRRCSQNPPSTRSRSSVLFQRALDVWIWNLTFCEVLGACIL